MGFSVQLGTPGAMLLHTDSSQVQHRTLTGLSLEEALEEALQLWPLSPATCEGALSKTFTGLLNLLTKKGKK